MEFKKNELQKPDETPTKIMSVKNFEFGDDHVEIIKKLVQNEIESIMITEDKKYLKFKVDFKNNYYIEFELLMKSIFKTLIFSVIGGIVFTILTSGLIVYFVYEIIKISGGL